MQNRADKEAQYVDDSMAEDNNSGPGPGTASFASIPLSSLQSRANLVEDQAPTPNLDYALVPDIPLQVRGDTENPPPFTSHNQYNFPASFPFSSDNRDTTQQSTTTPALFFPSQYFSAFTDPSQASTNVSQFAISMPEELMRTPSGMSVQSHDSILEVTGRTYQSFREGRYFLPNDPAEQDRLDLQHASFELVLGGKLGLAPVHEPKLVIDVATGTGVWANEFARRHPDSHIVGTDLSLIQPANSPANCEFIKDDAEEDWVFPQYKFDYVYLRAVFTCFNDPRRVMRHAFDNMKEGGWIEYMDFELELRSDTRSLEGSAVSRWARHAVRGAAALGRDLKVARHYKDWLIETGFVDVVEWKFQMPLGTWPTEPRQKQIGDFTRTNSYEGARGIGLKMISGLGLPLEEIEKIIQDAKHEIKTNVADFEAYYPGYVVYGRKPHQREAGTSSAG
ncbi:S-adenosyl-L-methionine-dependent methyltransferase [Apiospora arundinis]|uniref:S-adenosyl-L-methionine-dependent methyltransferase n=1 Tax=Apiospora arundinis TaxID=335852 RepID=A0ABR2HR30_9PEZI